MSFISGSGAWEAEQTKWAELSPLLTGPQTCGLHQGVKIRIESCATDQRVGAAVGTATVLIQVASLSAFNAPPVFHGRTRLT